MGFWYNEAKDGDKFANIAITDWNSANTTVKFSELGIKASDEYYHLYAYFTDFNDIINTNDKKWIFTPQLATLKIARKDHEKYSYKDKKKIPYQQHDIERFYSKVIEEKLEDSCVYSGYITLRNENMMKMILDGKDYAGNPMPVELLQSLASNVYGFVKVETPELIKLDDIALPSGKSGSWGSKGQTELEKLNDRVSFICSQLKLIDPLIEATSLPDIINLIGFKDSTQSERITAILEYAMQVIK